MNREHAQRVVEHLEGRGPAIHQITQRLEASRDVPFWIVRRMQPGLQIPRAGHFFRHDSREVAEQEAQRLAVKFPGSRFVVLEAVAAYCVGGAS